MSKQSRMAILGAIFGLDLSLSKGAQFGTLIMLKGLLTFLFIIFSSLELKAQTIADIRVDPPNQREVVESILPLKRGDKFDSRLIDISKSLLNATDRFKSLDVRWDQDSNVLNVSVVPHLYFEDINFVGDRISFGGELRRICFGIHESMDMTQERLSQLSRCILQEVQGRGFLDGQVSIEPVENQLNIQILLGDHYYVSEVVFSGANKIPVDRLERVLANRPNRAFRPLKLDEDTKNILKQYLNSDFYFAEVFSPTIELLANTKGVRLTWNIRENLPTVIDFEGDFFERNYLKRFIDREETFPKWFLEELVDEIKHEFVERGYLNVVVTTEKRLEDGGVQHITIRTNKGVQFSLTEPDLIGVSNREKVLSYYNSISELRAGAAFREEAYRKAIKEDLTRVLINEGFIDFQVRSIDFVIDAAKYTVRPVLYMNEGDIFPILESGVEGMPDGFRKIQEAEDLRDAIRSGKKFDSTRIDDLQKELARALINLGYLDAEVTRDSKRLDSGLSIRIIVNAGPRYKVAKVLVRGAVRTKYKVLRREVLLREGDIFEQEKVRDSISQIFRLGIVRNVDIQILEKDPKAGLVYVLVDVNEAARLRFDIGPGYGTVDGLRAVFRGTYANIGGDARRLNMFLKANRRFDGETPAIGTVLNRQSLPFIQRRITLEYFEPSLFDFSVDGRLSYTHSKQDLRRLGLLSNSFRAAVDYRWSRKFIFTTHYDIEFSDPFNVKIGTNTTDRDKELKRLTSIGETITLDFRDDEFNPIKGLRTILDFDFYSPYLGGQESFWQQQARQEIFFPLYTIRKGKVIGFAFAISEGFSGVYGDRTYIEKGTQRRKEIPVEKRFAIGGENSVRGFGEKSISPRDRDGGDSFFSFMSEAYIPIAWGIDLLGFFDGGNSFRSNRTWRPWDLRYGAGPGVRVNTPVGPLKFGYGFVLNRRCEVTQSPCPSGKYDPIGTLYFGVGPI